MPEITSITSSVGPSLKACKALKFEYVAPAELMSLLEQFRSMCNEALRIAIAEKPPNKFRLQSVAYPRLKEYGLHSHYAIAACQVAFSIFRNKARKSVPYIHKAFLKLDNETYRLNHMICRIPTSPKRFLYLVLRGSQYHMSFIDDPTLKRGSITVTETNVIISFSKTNPTLSPSGQVGIDVNERNVTWSTTGGVTKQEDTSEVVEIAERYKELRARIGRLIPQDSRIRGALYARYGKRERNRTTQVLHRITREIVNHAMTKRLGIRMENLKGIRRRFRKGNKMGAAFRGRLNSWMFREFQRQVEYKAEWIGVPVIYVNPRGTSKNCPDCGSHVALMTERRVCCLSCDKTWDRDVLASRNIMACVVSQARPPK